MGCCGKGNKKTKSKSDVTKKNKTNKVEKKKNVINNKDKKTIDEKKHHLPTKIIDQNQLLKSENIVQQEPPHDESTIQVTSPLITDSKQRRIKSPSDSDIDDIITADNIHPIKTLTDLQTFVHKNEKPVSIVLFYGRYCPYSKRTIPGLRQWAQANRDRIFLYEADVEQASKLAEYYHVRTIPTIMAFNENNLLAPIWQRTANNVFSSDLQTPENEPEEFQPIINKQELSIDHNRFEEIFRGKLDHSNNVFLILDPSLKGSNRILKKIETSNENKQEQYLIILDNNQSMPNQSKLMLAITNEKGQAEFLKTIDHSNLSIPDELKSKSITSSQQSPYVWNRSIRTEGTTENDSQKQLITEEEYNGRMISQSAISTIFNDDQSKKKRTWSEHLDDDSQSENDRNEYQQHIHLPNCNEIYYEKQYDNNIEFDRSSTLTYQHVKDTNDLSRLDNINQQEEICVLYLGPNRRRGFEDNLPDENKQENHRSKLSLLTLKSHSLSE